MSVVLLFSFRLPIIIFRLFKTNLIGMNNINEFNKTHPTMKLLTSIFEEWKRKGELCDGKHQGYGDKERKTISDKPYSLYRGNNAFYTGWNQICLKTLIWEGWIQRHAAFCRLFFSNDFFNGKSIFTMHESISDNLCERFLLMEHTITFVRFF